MMYRPGDRVFAMDDPSEFKRIVAGCVGDPGTRDALLKDAIGT